MKIRLLACAVPLIASAAMATPVIYTIDPNHTYPSFETDHMGGLSVWRGKFNTSSGSITLDREGKTGTVTVQVAVASIDFGNDKLNEHARSEQIFNAEKFPTATYTGKLAGFTNGVPAEVDGTLELHGVTKPLKLKIDSFLCKPHPMTKKEVCGADASTTFNRDDFGVDFGKTTGVKQQVTLRIQVEATRVE